MLWKLIEFCEKLFTTICTSFYWYKNIFLFLLKYTGYETVENCSIIGYLHKAIFTN